MKVQITSITKGIPISQWDVLASRYTPYTCVLFHAYYLQLFLTFVRERRKSEADASEDTPDSDITLPSSYRGLSYKL